MQFRLALRTGLLGVTLVGASFAGPAFAHDGGHHPDTGRERSGGPGGYDAERARTDWLSDCRARMPGHAAAPGSGPDGCEAFLDDYYARARAAGPGRHEPGYAAAPTYGYSYGNGYGYYGQPCCMAPMVMVPVMQPKATPDCTETVEYVYEDVPARRQIRRAPRRAPDKRIRIAPDKRIRAE